MRHGLGICFWNCRMNNFCIYYLLIFIKSEPLFHLNLSPLLYHWSHIQVQEQTTYDALRTRPHRPPSLVSASTSHHRCRPTSPSHEFRSTLLSGGGGGAPVTPARRRSHRASSSAYSQITPTRHSSICITRVAKRAGEYGTHHEVIYIHAWESDKSLMELS
jgi:hypothetical protein